MKKLLIAVSALAVLVLAGPASAYWEFMEEKYLAAGGGSMSASPLTDGYLHARFVEQIPLKVTVEAVQIAATINVTVTKLLGASVNANGYSRIVGVWLYPRNGSTTDYFQFNTVSAASNTCFQCAGGTSVIVKAGNPPVWVPLDAFGQLGVSAYIEATSGNMGLGIATVQYLSTTRI